MEEGFKKCPYCGEDIKGGARKCRFCGEFLDGENESINKDLNGNDRMRRGIYFRNIAILLVGSFLVGVAIGVMILGNGGSEDDINMVSIILGLINIGISIPWSIKRCHDIGWSGWLSVLTIVPLISWIMYILLFFVPGTNGENKYGPKPD